METRIADPTDEQSRIAYLTLLFRGETVYSWCARLHRLSGNTNARLTCRQLFGDSTAGLQNDFPDHLDELAARAGSYLEPVDSLIYDRTVFGIFAPFLSPTTSHAVIQYMRHGASPRIKHQLGSLPSRVGPVAPLKACPTCLSLDAKKFHTSWWHLEHQWPTTMVCPKHGDYLLVPAVQLQGKRLHELLLPNASLVEGGAVPDDKEHDMLAQFCLWSNYLASRCHDPFDHGLLRLTYHLRAKAFGWASMDGSLHFKQIRSAFRARYSRLDALRGLEFIRETAEEHGGFLGSLLRRMDANRHPVKHMLLMDFLFGSPSEFATAYDAVVTMASQTDVMGLWARMTRERDQLGSLVRVNGYSVSAAARTVGLPIGQSIRHLQHEGIEYKRRARVLNRKKELELQRLLRRGEERNVIAATLEIRKGFIKDYLTMHPGLRESWQTAHYKRERIARHAGFLRLLKDHPEMSLKRLRTFPSNGIQWLYRHDRPWLTRAMKSLEKMQR